MADKLKLTSQIGWSRPGGPHFKFFAVIRSSEHFDTLTNGGKTSQNMGFVLALASIQLFCCLSGFGLSAGYVRVDWQLPRLFSLAEFDRTASHPLLPLSAEWFVLKRNLLALKNIFFTQHLFDNYYSQQLLLTQSHSLSNNHSLPSTCVSQTSLPLHWQWPLALPLHQPRDRRPSPMQTSSSMH